VRVKSCKGFLNTNCSYVKGEFPFCKTTRILSVVSSPEMLWLAYKKLKGNLGILTKAASVSRETFNNYTNNQKEIFFRKKIKPDGRKLNLMVLVLGIFTLLVP